MFHVSLFLGATTENLPPGVLYRVVATYKYDAEDTDELSFEKGEIISVVAYDDPETQASYRPFYRTSLYNNINTIESR